MLERMKAASNHLVIVPLSKRFCLGWRGDCDCVFQEISSGPFSVMSGTVKCLVSLLGTSGSGVLRGQRLR